MRSSTPCGIRALALAGAAALVLVVSGASQAAPLKWSGTLQVHLDTMTAAGLGSGYAEVNGSGGGTHLNTLAVGPHPAVGTGGFATAISAGQPGSGVTKVSATLTGPTGTFAGGGAGALAGTATFAGAIGIKRMGQLTVTVPVTGVVGGSGTAMGSNGTTALTFAGTGWTTGVATAMSGGATVSRSGFASGPLSNTSSTATTSGRVKLVTPVQVTSNVPSPATPLALFVEMELHFVPEPGMLMMLGSGVLGLLLLGGSRIRR